MKPRSRNMRGGAFCVSQKTTPTERSKMENVVSKPADDKKEWVAPELKKVSIEELTAHLHLLRPLNDDDPTS